ncbi:hypothetical protein V9L05_17995 [Bernardetia sp. Wsw4-3y2]|uniref:hypothetical protein n=1 Tax=Bernardetia sp. Wsw4-3y2 TaxID=3127471 RepID=UPI0030D5B2F2
MENIANSKYRIDNMNFFATTTAGNTYVIILTVLVNTVGYMFFFKMIFTDRIAEYDAQMANWLPYVIGFVFSLVMSSGSYFSIINGYERLGKVLFWLSIVLSISTYAMMLLTDIPSFSKLVADASGAMIEKWSFGKEEMKFILKCFAVFVLAVTPDFVAKEISKEVSEKYKTDKYMEALGLQLAAHQELRIEREMQNLAKSSSSTEDEELKRMQDLMKALGRKQRIPN